MESSGREFLESLKEWDHGGGSPGSCELDASTTINPLGPPFSMELLWRDLSACLSCYPDPTSGALREQLSSFYGLPVENILPGGGATALLYRLTEILNPSRLLLPRPVFSEYPKAGSACLIPLDFVGPGSPLPHTPWPVDPGFSSILEKACHGDLVVLVNPVNPTGEEFSRESVIALGQELCSKGASLLVDESFQDFIGCRSSVLPKWNDLSSSFFVLKSFTKISGLAGIRTGALFGPSGVLSVICERMGPWSLGLIEQRVIGDLIANRRISEEQCVAIDRRLDVLSDLLLANNFPVSRGAGPFLLARTGWGSSAVRLSRKSLEDYGVRLRVATGFGVQNGEDWVRIGFQGLMDPGRVVSTLKNLAGV
jgi:threonine-phosphate decarboxylase